jgi:hypothetical protein
MLGIVCSVVALAVGAQDSPKPTTAPAPTIHVVSNVDLAKGVVIVEKVKVRAEKRQVKEVMWINGRDQSRMRSVLVHMHEVHYVPMRIRDAEARTVAGQSLCIDEVMQRLRPGMRLVVSTDGMPVAAEHLKNFPPETIVLIPPPRE